MEQVTYNNFKATENASKLTNEALKTHGHAAAGVKVWQIQGTICTNAVKTVIAQTFKILEMILFSACSALTSQSTGTVRGAYVKVSLFKMSYLWKWVSHILLKQES